jgi:hypothetical protein
LYFRVGGDQRYHYLFIAIVVFGEEWAQRTVYQTGDQDLIVTKPAFAFEKRTGDASCGSEFFLVVYGQGEKGLAWFRFGVRNHCSEQHAVA